MAEWTQVHKNQGKKAQLNVRFTEAITIMLISVSVIKHDKIWV